MSTRTTRSATTKTDAKSSLASDFDDDPNDPNFPTRRRKGPRKTPSNRGANGPGRGKLPSVPKSSPIGRGSPLHGGVNRLGGRRDIDPLLAAEEREKINLANREIKLMEKENKKKQEEEEKKRMKEAKDAKAARDYALAQLQQREKMHQQQDEFKQKWQAMEVDGVLLFPDEGIEDAQLQLALEMSLETAEEKQVTDSSATKTQPVIVKNQSEREMRKKLLQAQLRQIEEEERLEKQREKHVTTTSDYTSPLLEEERLLKLEQDEAFIESLRQDRLKDEQKLKQQEIQHKKQQAELTLKQKRQLLKQNLPPEPPQTIPSSELVALSVRMKSGRFNRKFYLTDTIKVLQEYIESLGADYPLGAHYEITADYPKRTFHDKDPSMTLREAGLHGSEVIHVTDS